MTDDKEIKLRLIEAAAQLPAVRQHVDPELSAGAAKTILELWYNAVVTVPDSERPVRKTLSLPGKKKKG